MTYVEYAEIVNKARERALDLVVQLDGLVNSWDAWDADDLRDHWVDGFDTPDGIEESDWLDLVVREVTRMTRGAS